MEGRSRYHGTVVAEATTRLSNELRFAEERRIDA